MSDAGVDSAADHELSAMLSPYVRGALEHMRGAWHIARRTVADYLLVYVISGAGRFSVDDDAFDVGPADLIWIPPGVLHEMRGHPPRMFVAYLHFDLVYDPQRSPRVRSGAAYPTDDHPDMHPLFARQPIAGWRGKLPVVNGPAIYALMKQAIAEQRGARRPLCVSGLMLQIIGEIATGLSPSAAIAGARWPALRLAAERIFATPEAELDLPAMARAAQLSESHFRKLFRETHGESPRAMRNRALMQKACELVLHSGASLSQIAFQLGFSTVHNFSRAFSREIGTSPRDYQRKMLGR
ncbi:MAG: Transcriptional regulator, AraC family [Sphingomonas bacterium]|uniref:helix-turn-helix domain-containing protein n=1 Tax=Sphingomonas bacterium TaxID=1895847 RepID=UPI002608D42F|nr:AraC family transcriptional regulator [Sphingomonas bacterium]MDB5709690.1 Transcriptional regulator, AraC family [Sphingomonas bacterium]